MKKIILLTVVSMLSFIMKADAFDFVFQNGGKDVGFMLVQNKINIRLKIPMTQDELFHNVKHPALLRDEQDPGTSKFLWMLPLDKSYTLVNINKIISDLDKIDAVDYAAPVLNYKDDYVAMTTEIIFNADGVNDDDLTDACDAMGLTDMGGSDYLPESVHILKLAKENISRQFEFVNTLLDDLSPEYVQPNLVRYMHEYITFNDPEYANQYALTNINAVAAWAHNAGGNQTIHIAVLDQGVDLNHTDLLNRTTLGYDATYYMPTSYPPSASSQSFNDTQGGYEGIDEHGTECAGIIGADANNSAGLVGLAFNCKIVPIRMAYNHNPTTEVFITDDVIEAKAFNYARITGLADVISCSWGGGSPSPLVEAAIHDAITLGRLGKGIPVFFAAGNDGTATLPWPAYLPDVIAVGATDASDVKASFSNYSTPLDISAPGDHIMTTDLSGSEGQNTASGQAGDYDYYSGTSFSCPYAAGLMGLILSVNSSLSQTDARMVIESTCAETGGYAYNSDAGHSNKKWSNELGYGRIDANAALIKAESLLPVTATAPLVTIGLEASPICVNSTTTAYFDLNLTGGNPYPQTTGGGSYSYFRLKFYTDANYNVASPYIAPVDIITSSTDPLNPGSHTKRYYFNLSSVASNQYPFTFTFFVDVEGNMGVHTHTGTMTVVIQSMPEFSLTPVIHGCEGQSLYLQPYVSITGAGISTSYNWNMGPFSTYTPNIPAPWIESQSGSGPIALTLTSSNGCVLTKSANVDFINTVISGNESPKLLCTGSAASPMGATAVTSYGGCTYSWSPATGLSNPNILNPTFTATATAGTYTYVLTATSTAIGGCSKSAAFIVDVQGPQSPINITSSVNNDCPGKPIVLTGNINGPYSVYTGLVFSDGTNNYSAEAVGPTASTTVSPMTSTTYTLTATDPYGCVTTGTINITINNSTNFGVTSVRGQLLCAGSSQMLSSNVLGGVAPYTYQWMPGNFPPANLTVPAVTQTYTLTVTDANGCKASTQVSVTKAPEYTFYSAGGYLGSYGVYAGQPLTLGPLYTGATGWGSGGTPPLSYDWTPHSEFVNPDSMAPTTQAITQSIIPTLTVTDGNGCQAKTHIALIAYAKTADANLFEESNSCDGAELCVDLDPVLSGLSCVGAFDANGNIFDPNNLPAGSVPNYYSDINSNYSYSPAPLSHTANCATFSSGTTSVAITVTQQLASPYPTVSLMPVPPTTINYTFPVEHDARHFMLPLKNNTDVMYVATDQLLHCYYNIGSGAEPYRIIPTNGWGNVRVEGWLAQNETGTKVFFMGTDANLYSLSLNATTGKWFLDTYTIGMPVKSNIVYHENADELYYVGTDNHIYRVYFSSYAWHWEAVTPVNGWQGVTVDGYLALEPAPGNHVFFKGNDMQLYNLWGGTVTSPNLAMMNTMNGCAGEIIYNPNTQGLFFKGYDDKIHSMNYSGSSWQEGVMNATTSYGVDNYLTFDAAGNRIFYKTYDQTIHNIYTSGGQNYDGAVLYPTQPQYAFVAGDVTFVNNKVLYINKDKNIYQVKWDNSGGWFNQELVTYGVIPGNHAKTCTNQYRALMIAPLPDDGDDTQQAAGITELNDPSLVNVYPNPSEGRFTIEINSGAAALIEVYDVLGNKIRSIQKEKDKSMYELDLSASGKGIYLINILSDGKHTSKKIMIR